MGATVSVYGMVAVTMRLFVLFQLFEPVILMLTFGLSMLGAVWMRS